MNIYVCLFVEEEDSLWHNQLTRTLRRMGHEVFVPPAIGLSESWGIAGRGQWLKKDQVDLTDRILADVRIKHEKSGVDLFFCYLFPFQFTPTLFKKLKKISIPSVYFFCDNISNKKVAEEYAPHVTLNWVPESQAIEQFKRSGSRAIYLPMASNPDINYPMPVSETVEVSFVGAKNPYRRYMLGRTAESGLRLRIYGSGWASPAQTEEMSVNEENPTGARHKSALKDRLALYITMKKNGFLELLKYGFSPKIRSRKYMKLGEEYEMLIKDFIEKEHPLTAAPYPPDLKHSLEINKIYSMSSVSIGFNDQFTAHSGVFFHTNLRNFEATMAGACYLAEATPDIDQLFSDGKEIMIFHNIEELIDKGRFLLKNDTFRKQLRAACRKRALAEHAWEDRFNKLFSALLLKR